MLCHLGTSTATIAGPVPQCAEHADAVSLGNVYWISDRAIPQQLAATDWY